MSLEKFRLLGNDVILTEALERIEALGVERARIELLDDYWQLHPRVTFFKTVNRHARLLDVGANSGALAHLRQYCRPFREDIKMYGVDLVKGQFADLYEEYHILNIDDGNLPWADGFFDAIVISHVYEHLEKPLDFLADAFRLLSPGGRIYIEVPSPHSRALPNKDDIMVQGVPVAPSNFFDDSTHISTFSADEIRKQGEALGFFHMAGGFVNAPSLADDLIALGAETDDNALATYGFWLRTLWSTYEILHKPDVFLERLASAKLYDHRPAPETETAESEA